MAHKLTRHRDWVYIIGILIVLFGFRVLAVFASIKPVSNLSQIDGKCRIDLPLVITIPAFRLTIVSSIHFTNFPIITTTEGLSHDLQPRKPDCPSVVQSSQHPMMFPVKTPTGSAPIGSSDIHGKDYPHQVPMGSDFGPEKYFSKGTKIAYIKPSDERRFNLVAVSSSQLSV